MLRRKPTAITLTTEDIAIYEDTRAREAAEQISKEEFKERQLSQNQMHQDPNPSPTNQRTRHELAQDNIQEPTMQERILGQGSHRRY